MQTGKLSKFIHYDIMMRTKLTKVPTYHLETKRGKKVINYRR